MIRNRDVEKNGVSYIKINHRFRKKAIDNDV